MEEINFSAIPARYTECEFRNYAADFNPGLAAGSTKRGNDCKGPARCVKDEDIDVLARMVPEATCRA